MLDPEVQESLLHSSNHGTNRRHIINMAAEELLIGTLHYSDDDDDDDDGDYGDRSRTTGSAAADVDELLCRLRALQVPDVVALPPSLPPQVLVSELDPAYRVERVRCGELSVADFRNRIAHTACPIIIEGLPVVEAGVPALNAEVVRAALPADLSVPVRGRGGMRADRFFEELQRAEGSIYLADASLTRHFPWMHRLLRVPRYFLHCFAHRTRQSLSIAHDTPALFVGSAGTRSSLHIDQMRSNFWMFLGEGHKHWTTFHPDDSPLLSPSWDDPEQIERFRPLAELEAAGTPEAAAVARARRLEFTISAGDTLYIPRGTPHEVANLSRTTAVSANFVDQSNVAEVISQTQARFARCLDATRAPNLRAIAEALDEIEWPALEDDLGPEDADGALRTPEELVGRFAIHERSMSINPVRLAV